MWPRGFMANAQTHCLQLPHTYAFAHCANGGKADDLDLPAFADTLIPDAAQPVAEAWKMLEDGADGVRTEAATNLRELATRELPVGPNGGLLFGAPHRFLIDLSLNLELRNALEQFRDAVRKGRPHRTALRHALTKLLPYQKRIGFADCGGGPIASLFTEPLRNLQDPGINRVLADYRDWRRPEIRNGIFLRLLDAVCAYAERE